MQAQDTWKFYRDRSKRRDWRWRRIAANGEVVGASTEGYRNKSGCLANAIRNGYSCDSWKFYMDKRGEWRWQRRARNYKVVGASTEGYVKHKDCVLNARRHGYSGR